MTLCFTAQGQSPAPPWLAQKHPESQRRTGAQPRSRELGTEQGANIQLFWPESWPVPLWLTSEPKCLWVLQRRLTSLQGVAWGVADIAASTRSRHPRLPWCRHRAGTVLCSFFNLHLSLLFVFSYLTHVLLSYIIVMSVVYLGREIMAILLFRFRYLSMSLVFHLSIYLLTYLSLCLYL